MRIRRVTEQGDREVTDTGARGGYNRQRGGGGQQRDVTDLNQ